MISIYIKYTSEQKNLAGSKSIVDILHQNGEKVTPCKNEYIWESPSGLVSINNNVWFHHYDQEGGNTIDFVRKFFNKSFVEAMEYLLNGSYTTFINVPKRQPEKLPLEVPSYNSNMKRVYAYLIKNRGIDKEVLNEFVKAKMIFESENYHNAVFVGYDSDGKPQHIHQRGTVQGSSYKQNAVGSDNKFSFHWIGESNELYLFEAPIDMLSFITMNPCEWQRDNYAASCSVADKVLFQCLEDNPNISKVYICFDNDEAGQNAASKLMSKLSAKGISSESLVPTYKDWNEDLLNYEQGESQTWTVELS